MRRAWFAAASAMLLLVACGPQGLGPPLPPVQEGAQAPSTPIAPEGPVQRGRIDEEVRQEFTASIASLLDRMQTELGGAPMPDFADQIVEMEPGTDHRQLVTLTGGVNYRIVGACDGDCANLDIELIDMTTGGVVASDMQPDDFPIVDFTPPADGQYMVRSLMQACRTAPCFAGARVLTAAK